MKLFPADEISFLLTADQAEQLALALHKPPKPVEIHPVEFAAKGAKRRK
jgi:hypothetical protein